MASTRRIIRTALVADAAHLAAAPGAVLIDGDRIVAAGAPEDVGAPADAIVVDRPDAVLLPALVNVHTHLDLSHVGPVPFAGDFTGWAEAVRDARTGGDDAIAAAVRRGVRLSRAGGTAVIGDIAGAGSRVPIHELRRSPLRGVSFLEVFGHGRRQGRAIEAMSRAVEEIHAEQAGVKLGLQPHAPYSCGPAVYLAATGMGRPLATHLAETLEELRFVDAADGPLAEMLSRMGVWDDSIVGLHRHPIEALAEALSAAPFIAAHLNYLESHHLELLRNWNVTVAYCPRASAYFGHPYAGHPPHRYHAMLDAGIAVALGTDSLLCLDTPDRIGVLDEMRFLHRRDGTDPFTLLRMATVNGAKALGFDEDLVTFTPGPTAGVLACAIDPDSDVDPLVQVMRRDDPPEWVVGA